MVVVVAGATGLVGREVVKLLQVRPDVTAIHLLLRKSWTLDQSKIQEHKIGSLETFDYEELPVKAVDIVFCCLGTTIKKAKSKEAFRALDETAVVKLARWAKSHGAQKFSVVSALGAKSESSIFYNQVKGQMEQEVQTVRIPHTLILRPSLLLGHREEFRLGEVIGSMAMRLLAKLMVGSMRKYQAVRAENLALAMVGSALSMTSELEILENDRILAYEPGKLA